MAHAHTYITVCIPAIFCSAMFDLKKRYLNCLQVAWVPMLAQVGATLLHIFWCWLLTIHYDLSVLGLGIATVITNFGMLFFVEIYSLCISRISESLFWPDAHTFKDWGEYFKLGVPATVMLCAEWWSFEILVFLSGILGVN